MENNLKIISAEVKNFQSIEMKKVDIAGRSIAVVGKNDGSKSSLIRAIMSPLTAKAPKEALKKGEDSGMVRVNLKGSYDGEEKEYTYEMYFDEKNQNGRLVVKDEEGNEIKSNDVRKGIIGDISFDPFEFIRMGKTSTGKVSKSGVRDQIELLMEFIDEKDRQRLLEIEADIEKIKSEDRKYVKSEITRLKTELQNHGLTEKELESYQVDKSKELNEAEQSLSNVSEKAQQFESIKYRLDNKKEKLEANVNRMADLKKEIERIEQENDKLAEDISKGEKWVENNKDSHSTEDLVDKIQELRKHQEMFGKVTQLKEKAGLLEEKEEQYKKLGEKRDALDKERKEIFASSNLPLKKLAFDSEKITYDGVLLDEEHHPKSLIVSVGVKIAMALNPNLRCIFVHDGSLLDKKTYEWLLKEVEKRGYQLIIEMVDWDASDTDIKFAEEMLK